MSCVNFFKQQSKRFLKDYKTRVFNENKGVFEFFPRFFPDIEKILYTFHFEAYDDISLMNAQHIIARLAGFNKWNDLIKASDDELYSSKLRFISRF